MLILPLLLLAGSALAVYTPTPAHHIERQLSPNTYSNANTNTRPLRTGCSCLGLAFSDPTIDNGAYYVSPGLSY